MKNMIFSLYVPSCKIESKALNIQGEYFLKIRGKIMRTYWLLENGRFISVPVSIYETDGYEKLRKILHEKVDATINTAIEVEKRNEQK